MAILSELLSNIPLFALLHDGERAALAARIDEVSADAGSALFHAGDPGDAMYVVLEGEVEIYFKNTTGERILLECAQTGDFFGELSLLDGGPRMASALVTKSMRALKVDREDLQSFLEGCPRATMSLMTAMGRRLRESTGLLRGSASRNVNIETEDKRTRVQRAADWISDFSGSLEFLFMHIAIFAAWIFLNVAPLNRLVSGGFDPYPFGLLTMCVSLEAIILSVFVLLSQNRQVARDRVRNDIEYDVNLKAELEVAQLHEKVDRFYEEVVGRLDRLEKSRERHSTASRSAE
jgi:CRP/FNR family transcriptional regulator, cyclic AMP receptor protein